MKKIYAYILSMVIVNFISCMEQQKPRLFEAVYNQTTTNNSLVSYHNDNAYSHHDIHPPTFSIPLQVNEPGWQQLNAIANMTYNTPVYRRVETARYSVSQQELQQAEKKTLLKTNNIAQPDNEAIKKDLYDSAQKLAYYTHNPEGGVCELVLLRNIFAYGMLADGIYKSEVGYELGLLSNKMRSAKEKQGVTEDMMGSYAYNENSNVSGRLHYRALIFSLLKKYIHMTSIKPEQLPFNDNQEIIIPIDFTQSLHKTNNQMFVKYSALYPAFSDLVYNVYYILKIADDVDINTIASFFYPSDHKKQKNSYLSQYQQTNNYDFNDFYTKAFDMVSNYSTFQQIYDFLQMIEASRKTTIESHEDKLAQKMIDFSPSTTDLIFNVSYWRSDCFSQMEKKYIFQLFTLIKKYNQTRHCKITPTPKQYIAYKTIQRLAIPLPDSWNSNVFDTEQYAFNEFFYLVNAINELKRSFDCEKTNKY